METDVDLTELDDWLGTLEELQLGLEKNCPDESKPVRLNSIAHEPIKSHVNQTFRNATQTAVTNSISTHRTMGNPSASGHNPTNVNGTNKSVNYMRSSTDSIPLCQNGIRHLPPISPGRNPKEVTAERNLTNLLRDLEMYEENMRDLDQEDNTYKRRYSLASSPSKQNERRTQNFTDTSTEASRRNTLENTEADSGFISAQWAADLHMKPPKNEDGLDLDSPESPVPCTDHTPPPPPAFLGAGDACVSPPDTPQPNSLPLGVLQRTEAGMWCMNNNQLALRSNFDNPNHPSNVSHPIGIYPPHTMNQLVNGNHRNSRNTNTFGDYETQERLFQQMRDWQGHPVESQVVQPAYVRPGNNVTFCTQPNRTPSVTDVADSTSSNSSDVAPNKHIQYHVGTQNLQGLGSASTNNLDINTSSSDINNWSLGQSTQPRNGVFYSNSVSSRFNGNRLSSSNSPHSSLSDRSLPEPTEGSQHHSYNGDSPQVKKLCVRIFRPDRTTKAIMLSEDMTAGQVASLLIEKNFLTPSPKLVVVEKVPALKVEHVFEEHENLAECIMSWPAGSQNMIFFEERSDQFGFIHSPIDWFGEEFAQKYCYNNEESVLSMLRNFDQTGFPEWRDYLYIRKPGAKTWSRRLCVLRCSGLYTSKKNKKTLSSTDLLRVLVLDGPLQLYTTTGGWSRLRAPTPHGFAFKSYAAQDPTSQHVFCFCATDEMALRHWICRLRIAKFGKQLFTDYHTALSRVQLQLINRHIGSNQNLNGSLSAILHRKSSCELVLPQASSPNPSLGPAGSTSNLLVSTGSPSITKKPALKHPLSSQRPQIFQSQIPHAKSPLLNVRPSPMHSPNYGPNTSQKVPIVTRALASTNGNRISHRNSDNKQKAVYLV